MQHLDGQWHQATNQAGGSSHSWNDPGLLYDEVDKSISTKIKIEDISESLCDDHDSWIDCEDDEVSSVHDDIIKEERELGYEENYWPSNGEDPVGFNFKGKQKKFCKAIEKIKKIFIKGFSKKAKDVTFKVLTKRKVPNGGLEIDVKVFKGEKNGIAILKIFSSNGKKGSSLTVNKTKKHSAEFVTILATDVVKPLLDKFISGEGWDNFLLKPPAQENKKIYTCEVCKKNFCSERNVNIHVRKFHNSIDIKVETNNPKLIVNNSAKEEGKKIEDDLINFEDNKMEVDDTSPIKDSTDKLSEGNDKGVDLQKRKREDSFILKNVADKKIKHTSSPENIKELPHNIKHLVNEGDLELVVPSDGACAANSGAGHIFQDPSYGPTFRMLINNHIVEKWEFYKHKISFPYTRQVGVKGHYVNFESGEEDKFLRFLETKAAAFLWCDSEDLQVMANIYQMKIKVITTKGHFDKTPTVNWIGPDSELDNFKLLPEGVIPMMTLIHYDNSHYNLVISKDSKLSKMSTPSKEVFGSESIEKMDDYKIKYEALSKDHVKCQDIIKQMRTKTLQLEEQLKAKTDENEQILKSLQKQEEKVMFNNKNEGFTRETPQYESVQKFPKSLQCEECKKYFQSKELLKSHVLNHRRKYSCNMCNKIFTGDVQLNKHVEAAHTSLKDFNCNDCLFQGDDIFTLKKHLDTKQHTPSVKPGTPLNEYICDDCPFKGDSELALNKHLKVANHQGTTEDTNKEYLKNDISCHSCGLHMDSRQSLMKHRKENHVDILKKCKYFQQGRCAFEADICWYRHDNIKKIKVGDNKDFPCSFCENVFSSKSQLMSHRKQIHPLYIRSKCRDFIKGDCKFSSDCWYVHDEKYENGNMDFQQVQNNPHPPDLIQSIVSMMEKISAKVLELEESAKK